MRNVMMQMLTDLRPCLGLKNLCSPERDPTLHNKNKQINKGELIYNDRCCGIDDS